MTRISCKCTARFMKSHANVLNAAIKTREVEVQNYCELAAASL